ncbi:MAG: toll/interleukin-1 receptor domain-containing protein [Bryobacterales bacterium]|nr:toll/interleukin-1 receptor domain-containing protein [Bryobacterales bacterium]
MTENGDQLVRLLRQCLEEASSVEIDGLGVFRRRAGGFDFFPAGGPRVFIAYVAEDLRAAERLFDDLRRQGFDPWLDRKKLLPGQNWPRAIQQAIEVSDFFVACLSQKAVRKKGQFQAELRYALDCAARTPLDQIYLIPVRLEECPVPGRIGHQIHYVNLFPDWEEGVRRVAEAIRGPKKAKVRLPLAV